MSIGIPQGQHAPSRCHIRKVFLRDTLKARKITHMPKEVPADTLLGKPGECLRVPSKHCFASTLREGRIGTHGILYRKANCSWHLELRMMSAAHKTKTKSQTYSLSLSRCVYIYIYGCIYFVSVKAKQLRLPSK